MGSGASHDGTGVYLDSNVQSELFAQLDMECHKDQDAGDVDSLESAKQEIQRLRNFLRDTQHKVSHLEHAHENYVDPDTIYEDSEHTLDDGTTIITRADGYRKQTDTDGTTIESWPDGRKLQRHTDNSTLEMHRDGTKITTTAAGVKIVRRPDGGKIQTNVDGSSIETLVDNTVIHIRGNLRTEMKPDGTKTQEDTDSGLKIQIFPDGTKIDTDKEGHKIVVYPDGRRVQRNPNGTVIETWGEKDAATGEVKVHKVQTKADGSRIEIFPDGKRVQTGVDGKVTEILPDGTQIKKGRVMSAKEAVQCTKCQTIISVPRSSFVVCCSMCRNVMLAHNTKFIGQKGQGRSKNSQTPSEKTAEVKAIFDHFDTNKSGTLSMEELPAFLEELNVPFQAFEDIFKESDHEHNNTLTFDEFLEYFNKVQHKLLQNAQAPQLQMTRDLLEQQRKELEKEKKKLEHNKEDEAREQVDRIKEEYFRTMAQLNEVKAAQRERQKKYIEMKKAEIKARKQKKAAGEVAGEAKKTPSPLNGKGKKTMKKKK